jgi:hypothetical protein
MSALICRRILGSSLSWGSVLFLVLYVYITREITRVQVMLNSICSFIFFCGVVDSCGEIIMCVVYVVSCVGISLLPAIGYGGCFCSMVPLVC